MAIGIIDSYKMLPDDTREEIAQYWRNLAKNNSDTAWGPICNAWLFMIEGNPDGAKAEAEKVIGLGSGPAYSEAKTILALLSEHDGVPSEETSKLYKEAAEADQAMYARYRHAVSLRQKGDTAEAESVLRNLIETVSDDDRDGVQFIASDYVELLLLNGRRAEAREILDVLITRFPDVFILRQLVRRIDE